MSTPNTRKMHIRRIFGKDADGNDIKDIYVDVLRADEIKFQLNAGAQDINARLHWQDDSEDSANQSRETTTIKITDPQNPPADRNRPDLFIPLKLIKTLKVLDSGQEMSYRLHNEATDDGGNAIATKRTVRIKRVYFAPTPDVDDRLNGGNIVKADDYKRDESNVDKNQYLDVEVIEKSPTVLRSDNQDIDVVFNWKIFESDGQFPQDNRPSSNPDGSAPGIPLRLDWMQNIVNVCFGGATWFDTGVSAVLPLSTSQVLGPISILSIELNATSMSLSAKMGAHQHVDGELDPDTGMTSATLDIAAGSGSISATMMNSATQVFGEIKTGVDGGAMLVGCQTYTGPTDSGHGCVWTGGDYTGTLNGDGHLVPSSPPSVSAPASAAYACWKPFWFEGVALVTENLLPSWARPDKINWRAGTNSDGDAVYTMPTGWYIDPTQGADSVYAPNPPGAPINATRTGVVVKSTGSGNRYQSILWQFDRQSGAPGLTGAVDRSWQCGAFSYAYNEPPTFSSMKNGQDVGTTLERPAGGSNPSDGCVNVGDLAQFQTNIDCTPGVASPPPEYDLPDWEGPGDTTNLTNVKIGNGVINVTPPDGTRSGVIALLMVFDRYIDWSANGDAVITRNEAGELVARSSREIVRRLGAPLLWYEGGPSQFPKNRTGGANLAVTGKLKSFSPWPFQINKTLPTTS